MLKWLVRMWYRFEGRIGSRYPLLVRPTIVETPTAGIVKSYSA
jgi:hypothetical protein